MPKKKIKMFEAWSYSRLGDYETCPLMAMLKHLNKLRGPTNPAMERGARIHKEADQYVKGAIAELPASLELFGEEFETLRGLYEKRQVRTEMQVGLDESFDEVGWFAPETWVRIVFDMVWCDGEDVVVVDYKTGKKRESHRGQLSLYAVAAFAIAPPTVQNVRTELWYLDEGELVETSFTVGDVPKLKTEWTRRSKQMLSAKTFPPQQCYLCKYCDFSQHSESEHAGLCKY